MAKNHKKPHGTVYGQEIMRVRIHSKSQLGLLILLYLLSCFTSADTQKEQINTVTTDKVSETAAADDRALPATEKTNAPADNKKSLSSSSTNNDPGLDIPLTASAPIEDKEKSIPSEAKYWKEKIELNSTKIV